MCLDFTKNRKSLIRGGGARGEGGKGGEVQWLADRISSFYAKQNTGLYPPFPAISEAHKDNHNGPEKKH